MKKGGYFKFPNVVIDKLAAVLSGAEFKVLCVIIRQTIGWSKQWDEISISQFEKKTGLSRQGILDCVESLETKELILTDRNPGITTRYALYGDTNEKARLVKSVDRYTQLTGQLIGLDLVNSVDRLLVNSVDTQKTVLKDTKDNNYDPPLPPETEEDERFDMICDAFKKAIGGDPDAITLVSNEHQLEAFNEILEHKDEYILDVINTAALKGKLHQDNALGYVRTGLRNGWYGGTGGNGDAAHRAEWQKELDDMERELEAELADPHPDNVPWVEQTQERIANRRRMLNGG